ncbi:MAG: GtrA family protein, partial [Betaproteobacteria bacterium]|nr:GtrA family protein [Betaproteobacteria bacterium]
MLVYVVSVVGLIINQFALYTLVSQYSVELMLSKFIATFTVFAWNYSARNYFVFRHPRT